MIRKNIINIVTCVLLFFGCKSNDMQSFETNYMGIDVDSRGYIVGMWNLTRESRNFSPADQPSPLLSLYDGQLKSFDLCPQD